MRGVAFSEVGLCDRVLLAFVEGRKSDAMLKCNSGPKQEAKGSKLSSDGAPERDKGRGKPLPRRGNLFSDDEYSDNEYIGIQDIWI